MEHSGPDWIELLSTLSHANVSVLKFPTLIAFYYLRLVSPPSSPAAAATAAAGEGTNEAANP